MSQKNRRHFLKTTAGAAAAMNLVIRSKAYSANDVVNVAVIGVNGRGRDHIAGHMGAEGAQVVALCDIDERVLTKRAAEFKEKYGQEVKTFVDYRDLLKDKDIDAVSIATPNHWHSLQAIWACQAGKDVYVEKPLSHNIHEGRLLVEAARKHKRIVQHGTQIRSSKAIQEAMQMLHEGVIGEVYYAKGTCYKWRDTIGVADRGEKVPKGVHYDLWLGPAPEREYTENRLHYKWHWHWDYGNGDIGNQGVHQFDVARWGLGVGLPKLITCVGGHFMFEDDQETPNSMVATYKYPDEEKMMVFEVRHWMTNPELGGNPGGNVVGNLFLGSKGWMICPSYTRYQVYLGKKGEEGPGRNEGGDHYQNFIDCVKSRKLDELNADVEEGHLSSALCHLANAAYRTQRSLNFDPKTEKVIGDQEANDILADQDRKYRKPFELPTI